MIRNIQLKSDEKTYTINSIGGLSDALHFFEIIEEGVDLFVEVTGTEKSEEDGK